MDDKEIITLMFLSKSDAYLAMKLFKTKGYSKNKIKRLVRADLKRQWNNIKQLYYKEDSRTLSVQLDKYFNHLITSQLHHKFSSHYSISDVWKHLKIKFNKIR